MVHVSHNVTAFEFFYEPFYVSLDSAPLYDERFEGYGFTRNTQVFKIKKTTFYTEATKIAMFSGL